VTVLESVVEEAAIQYFQEFGYSYPRGKNRGSDPRFAYLGERLKTYFIEKRLVPGRGDGAPVS